MRALKTLLIILAGIGLLIVILGLTGQDTYRVERSTVIEAAPEAVYPYVSNLAYMKDWGPWQAMDPEQEQRIEGTDGTVGAVWSWKGEKVGTGAQTITALEPNRSVRSSLEFTEPFESRSDVSYDLEATAEGTKVVWANWGENDFMGRVMAHFGMMDRMLGGDFEQGLANLKELVEREEAERKAERAARTVDGYLIESIENPEQVYIGKRNKKLKWDDMEAFFGTHFGAVAAAMGAAGIEPAGAPSGVYWDWNEADRTTDLMAAMPVAGGADMRLEGFDTHVVPAGRMLKVAYYGDYSQNMDAHLALDKYIKDKGLEHYGNVIEEYVTDPMAEPDTAKWLTNIYYMVK